MLAAGLVTPVLPYLRSFAAGAMIYVLVEELVPEMAEGEHSNAVTILFAAGFTLMVALDVGGAIKGQHFDIYQGIGPDAGHRAGWYNHYGRVWVLKAAPGAGNVFSG